MKYTTFTKNKLTILILVFFLMVFGPTTPVLASQGPLAGVALQDNGISDTLMETLSELIETMRSYIETIQESVGDLVDNVLPGDREDDEPAPPAEEEPAPATGTVGGRLSDDEGRPVAGTLLLLNSLETETDRSGSFFFDGVPFGSYSLAMVSPNTGETLVLTSLTVDDNNPHYRVSLLVSLPDPDDAEEEVTVTELEEDPETGQTLQWVILLLTAILLLTVFRLLTRKHIQIIDAKTGQTLGKKRIQVRPTTRIDLAEELPEAYDEVVRIRFLRPVVQKLRGCRIVFLRNEQQLMELPEYTGELEITVRQPADPSPLPDSGESTGSKDGQ